MVYTLYSIHRSVGSDDSDASSVSAIGANFNYTIRNEYNNNNFLSKIGFKGINILNNNVMIFFKGDDDEDSDTEVNKVCMHIKSYKYPEYCICNNHHNFFYHY